MVTGLKTFKMDLEKKHGPMAHFTKVITNKVKKMVRVGFSGLTIVIMMESFSKITSMGVGNINGAMERLTKESGKIIN